MCPWSRSGTAFSWQESQILIGIESPKISAFMGMRRGAHGSQNTRRQMQHGCWNRPENGCGTWDKRHTQDTQDRWGWGQACSCSIRERAEGELSRREKRSWPLRISTFPG